MPIQIDIRKAPFYKLGREEGFKEGKREGSREGELRGLIRGLKKAILLDIQLKFGVAQKQDKSKIF
jgi:predicted transposase YdaD